jgi:hypothetical protein
MKYLTFTCLHAGSDGEGRDISTLIPSESLSCKRVRRMYVALPPTWICWRAAKAKASIGSVMKNSQMRIMSIRPRYFGQRFIKLEAV